ACRTSFLAKGMGRSSIACFGTMDMGALSRVTWERRPTALIRRRWPIDDDGHLDIVVSNDAPDRKLVCLNDGKGHFAEFGTFGDPKWSTRYVTLADLNGDGYPDIVAANRGDYPDLVDGKPG